jgi:hypothetical protein
MISAFHGSLKSDTRHSENDNEESPTKFYFTVSACLYKSEECSFESKEVLDFYIVDGHAKPSLECDVSERFWSFHE